MLKGESVMSQPVKVYQSMPDNLIVIHTSDDGKMLEVLADYKNEDHLTRFDSLFCPI
jgi:hypothetical protein